MYFKLILFVSAISLLSAEFQRNFRIIGGSDISPGKVPWQVSLQLDNRHICGGAIYSRDIIITAAHCVNAINMKSLSIRVESISHKCGKNSSKIASVYKHENFSLTHMLNDVAILLLATPIKPCDRERAIKLAEYSPPPGAEAMVSGWGKIATAGMVLPKNLQAVNVNIISTKKCQDAYPNESIKDESLCAGAPGKDACQGDSGGPLVYNHHLVGIASWGYSCALPDYPGVYTNVAVLHNWIVRAISVVRSKRRLRKRP